jgi:hypothetical protein
MTVICSLDTLRPPLSTSPSSEMKKKDIEAKRLCEAVGADPDTPKHLNRSISVGAALTTRSKTVLPVALSAAQAINHRRPAVGLERAYLQGQRL